MTENKKNDIKGQAPDGGWGWFVCLGSSLITLSLRSLDPSFGLLFKDLLEDLNVDSTWTSIIMGVLDAIVNFSGFLIGPLLKKYSYRQVAFFGSLLSCCGLIITSQANSIPYIICSYSVLGGLGTGLATASSFVALNTFFDKKRGQAVGFSMAGNALAMMFVPLLIHMLLNIYGFRGTILIAGGWALHSLVGSCLLRPLKKRSQAPPVEKKSDEKRENEALLMKSVHTEARRMSNGSMWTKDQIADIETISPQKKSFMNKLKTCFDLDLLKNSIYLNVALGCSFFYVAESNYKLMTPFFLSDLGMKQAEVAFCLSLTAFADILARLLLPTLFDKFGWKKRIIFWISSFLVGITRSILAEQSEKAPLIVTLVIAGFLRGATLVNLNLCISECCTLKKLPSAFGIFMVIKGLCVITMSPLIGYIRDVSGSYKICLHVMTAMILVTSVVWSIEFFYRVFCRQLAILAVLPVQQCFGLIFAERFASLSITATQTSLILHLNGTITCSLGLISGPMMKRFAFRQVAYFGSLTVVIGICAAAFAVSLPTLIITYCVIIGIGQGILFPATTLALNTYFRKKRNVAMGFSVTLTGLGPILMPFLIDVLLENFATTGTLLTLAGIASHSLIGASLLKPFGKQKESVLIDKTTNIPKEENSCIDETNVENNAVQCRLLNKRNAEKEREPNHRPDNSETEVKRNRQTSFLKKIVTNMDLDLLRDNRYIAIVLGMSISLVAETNFNATIPFVLAELANLDRTSIATVMSIQAAADITGRLCVPLLAQKTGWTCRNLYVLSLLGSTFGRTILSIWGNTYVVVIGVALIIGLAKGTKAVFQALIIPDYVPLERLPAASGIQMVCNGILSISIGPIIGLVHDSTNSYVGALYFTSFLSLSCVFLWLIDGLWAFRRNTLNEQNPPAPEEQ
ncbi:Monocarboxylate transporter 1 [Trachymyrmex zeteki]|uniref:Monocarboxylate transporter 1 n=1 Tax=Mycetomoellerius zeteki TaxID=64791 RepID=A0A151X7M3_9HYME|nr:Monocarboxylate transporter 1 [Trachymyrmex zeteki]